jgi:predicted metal-binding transcription factor (methanogenesis marker protein 9)
MNTTKQLTDQQDYILFKVEDGRNLSFEETMVLEKMIYENIIDYDQLPQSIIRVLEILAEVKQEETQAMIENYQDKLNKVVAVENYEDAAYYRDQINLIK